MVTKVDNDPSLRQSVVNMKDSVEGAAHQAGSKVRELYSNASQEARNISAAAEKEIRKHPISSAAAALGVGVLLGMLMRR